MARPNHRRLSLYRARFHDAFRRHWLQAGFVLLIAVTGMAMVYMSLAATGDSIGQEAEAGKLAGQVAAVAGSAASGGQAVRFGGETVAGPLLSTQLTTTLVAQQTGDASLNKTCSVNVKGTDLGELFNWGDKTYWLFGDTQLCNSAEVHSNTMAYSTSTDFSKGIKFDGWVKNGNAAKELVDHEPNTISSIPTSAVAVGDRAYMYYMNVTDWHPPAPNKWVCSGSSLATATLADVGAWSKQPAVRWGVGNFNMVAAMQEGQTIYLWGTPCGRMGGAKLMKVDAASALTKAAYRYYTGGDGASEAAWSSNESAAVTVAGGPIGEVAVMYNKWLGRYVMTYLDEKQASIVIRESPTPWGQWSTPIVMARIAQYPQLYGGFTNSTYIENDGQTIYWTLSMFGPYQVYLMKTTLQKR